jgi:hypothetical protein
LPPLTKYSLRGVCTDPSTTYLLLRDIDSLPESAVVHEQWWRCEVAAGACGWDNSIRNETTMWGDGTPPSGTSKAIKVTEEEVLNAAKTIGDCVLLVYANEEAFKCGNSPLPRPLKVPPPSLPSVVIAATASYSVQAFVDADNASFRAELNFNPLGFPHQEDRVPSPGRKRRASDDEVMTGDMSPKRSLRSVGSSTTLDVNTPVSSDNNHTPPEMMERGCVVSPVAKAFHRHHIIDGDHSSNNVDEDMIDVEYVEDTNQPVVTGGEQRKGG